MLHLNHMYPQIHAFFSMVSRWVPPEQLLPFQYWSPNSFGNKSIALLCLWQWLLCGQSSAACWELLQWGKLLPYRTHCESGNVSPPTGRTASFGLLVCSGTLREVEGKSLPEYSWLSSCTPIVGLGSFLYPCSSSVFWSFLLCRGQSIADFLYLVALPTPAWAARYHGTYSTGGIKKKNMGSFSSDN